MTDDDSVHTRETQHEYIDLWDKDGDIFLTGRLSEGHSFCCSAETELGLDWCAGVEQSGQERAVGHIGKGPG